MKITKDNAWNRLFHSKRVEEERNKYDKCKRICGFFHELYEQVKVSKDLLELLNLHKEIWDKELRNQNLAPCEYGMFRTKEIPNMTADEVYLGGIYGLNTHSIHFWQAQINCEEKMGPNGFGISEDTLIYELIVKQYRNHLLRNLNKIHFEALDYVADYETVNPVEDSFKLF